MSREARLARALHTYADGELGWWGRRRFETRMRRSPELRQQLAMLREIGQAARESEARIVAPGLWEELAGRLRAVDAQFEAAGDPASAGAARWLNGWRPLGAAALAAASALALVLALRAPGPLPAPALESAGAGVVRFLDTGGLPVLLMQESEDVTIIWLMDTGSEEL